MKVADKDADRFAKAPPAALRAVLAYGPDGGLVRERLQHLAASVVDDLNDPFRVTEISAAELRSDPARLADEAAALSFTGGRRLIRLRDCSDSLTDLFADFLEETPGDAMVLLEAGDLPNRSSLRKLFEGDPKAAALPCYQDDEADVAAVVRESFAGSGRKVSADAMAYLVANLGDNRQLTRRELEKLALYMGPGSGEVALADVEACIGDNAALGLDEIAFAMAGGDLPTLERKLARSLREGQTAVAILRSVSRHLQRLHLVAGMAAGGTPMEIACKKLRPPLFWKSKDSFIAQARNWPPRSLAKALTKLLKTEVDCKSSGQPAELLVARSLLEIAANAPRQRQRR